MTLDPAIRSIARPRRKPVLIPNDIVIPLCFSLRGVFDNFPNSVVRFGAFNVAITMLIDHLYGLDPYFTSDGLLDALAYSAKPGLATTYLEYRAIDTFRALCNAFAAAETSDSISFNTALHDILAFNRWLSSRPMCA